MKSDILTKLSIGDRRTTGKSDEAAREVLKDNKLFAVLVSGLKDNDPGIRMRSADAMEKVLKENPKLFLPFKNEILQIAKQSTQQEVQWHMAEIFTYVRFDTKEANDIFEIVLNYYKTSRSNIVKAFSLTTMAYLSSIDNSLKNKALRLTQKALQEGSPAVKSRARKILTQLKA